MILHRAVHTMYVYIVERADTTEQYKCIIDQELSTLLLSHHFVLTCLVSCGKWHHGCRHESVTSDWKSNSVNRCIFSWRNSCQISSRSDFKRCSHRLFKDGRPNKNKTSSDLISVPDLKVCVSVWNWDTSSLWSGCEWQRWCWFVMRVITCAGRYVTMPNSPVALRQQSRSISQCWRIASHLILCLQVLLSRYTLLTQC